MDNKRRFRGYYGFAKKFPSERGNVYAIGESKRAKKKELHKKTVLAVALPVLLAGLITAYFFCRNLSRRPIPEGTKPAQNTVLAADNIGKIRAIFIDNSDLDESTLTKKLNKAKADGFNSVMLDFKDEDGSVLFPVNTAIGSNAGEKNIISREMLQKIKNEGFTVVARIYCFCDSYAPQRTGAYVYEDAERTRPWFDAPAAFGGRVWLNPTDSRAVNYLVGIVGEAAAFGADCIYLNDVQFPVSGTTKPVFTEDDTSLSRNFVLLDFIEKASKKAGKCPLIVGFSFDGIDGDSEKWGGTLFDSAAAASSPEIPVSENYSKYAADLWLVLNTRAKNNYSTLSCIPTLKNMPENERFYEELQKNGAESYIIIP